MVAAYSAVRAGLLNQSKKASSVPPVGTDDAAVAVSRVHAPVAPLFSAAHLDAPGVHDRGSPMVKLSQLASRHER